MYYFPGIPKAIAAAGPVIGLFVCGNILAQEERDSGNAVPIAEALRTGNVGFNCTATPLAQVLDIFRKMTKINIVFDPNIKDARVKDKLIIVSINDVTFGKALDLILGTKLAFQIRDDVIVITERPPGPAEANAPTEEEVRLQAVLEGEKVDLDFQATPLTDVLSYLRASKKVNIVLDSDLRDPEIRNKLITLSFKNVTLRSALDRLMGDRLTYAVNGNLIFITEKSSK